MNTLSLLPVGKCKYFSRRATQNFLGWRTDLKIFKYWKIRYLKCDKLGQVALQQRYSNLYACQQHVKPFLQFTSRPNVILLPAPSFSILTGDKRYLTIAWICIFLITCEHKHLILAHRHYFFCKRSFHFLCSFFPQDCLSIFLLIYKCSLYMRAIISLSFIHVANIFS